MVTNMNKSVFLNILKHAVNLTQTGAILFYNYSFYKMG